MTASPDSADGSTAAFDRNWKERPESAYTHFVRGEPQNQIQLAFRQNWLHFARLLRQNWGDRSWKDLRALEVGAGRGTMSLYFAEAGFDCTMLDSSDAVLRIGRKIFAEQNLPGRFEKGDALALDYPDNRFDVVFSIGLLEHFESPARAIGEQARVLAPKGLLISYVVPERPDNVQAEYGWVNDLLATYARPSDKAGLTKEAVFRSNYASPVFLEAMKDSGLVDLGACGVYPLPMISPSVDFPFTLNGIDAERILVKEFGRRLRERERKTGQPGWLCDEAYGQAFFVWGRKV